MPFPLQHFPPLSGAGFVQLRMRNCKPAPHVVEQGAHSDQEDQLPSTEHEKQQ